jgi:hypothetical protein
MPPRYPVWISNGHELKFFINLSKFPFLDIESSPLFYTAIKYYNEYHK